jgi:hypothetical protein
LGSELIRDEKPPAKRVKTALAVEYRGPGGAGTGIISELSLEAAYVEEPSLLPELGTDVELSFRLSADLLPVSLTAEVVRVTAKEFELSFSLIERRVRDLLKLAIANASKAPSNTRHRDLLRRE